MAIRIRGFKKSPTAEGHAMRGFVLHVTRDVINNAVRGNASYCVYSQAVRFMGGWSPKTTAESISFNYGETRYTFPLPARHAYNLLAWEEEGAEMKPCKINLHAGNGFSRPVRRAGSNVKPKNVSIIRAPAVKRKGVMRRCVRRWWGLRIITIDGKPAIGKSTQKVTRKTTRTGLRKEA